MFDAVIIGAGVTGSAIARELAKYAAKICVLEKNSDVCEGTTKANSALIHAGFDAEPGTMKAKMNARGNAMMDKVSAELDVPFERIGALVCCFDESGLPELDKLLEKGIANGIPGLEIIDSKRAKELEPALQDNIAAALYAPSAGITCPFELTMGFAENAAMNGVEFRLNTKVTGIEKTDAGYKIETNNGTLETKAVINAAGVYADEIHNMVCDEKIKIIPRKGEYNLLDKATKGIVERTIFPLPTKLGKGVLVTPTIFGNPLVGPTSEDIDDKEQNRTSGGGLAEVQAKSSLSVKNVPLNMTITSFAGLRAHLTSDDFIIEETAEGFFDAAGIESPGLSSSPAIGEYVAEMVAKKLKLKRNEGFNPYRKRVTHLLWLSREERKRMIEENPAYGAIVCRCEEVSEGEILDAIHRPLGATTLDGVKRRTRATTGRCQAGFCSPRIMEILARELNLPLTQIKKNDGESVEVFEKTRKGVQS